MYNGKKKKQVQGSYYIDSRRSVNACQSLTISATSASVNSSPPSRLILIRASNISCDIRVCNLVHNNFIKLNPRSQDAVDTVMVIAICAKSTKLGALCRMAST